MVTTRSLQKEVWVEQCRKQLGRQLCVCHVFKSCGSLQLEKNMFNTHASNEGQQNSRPFASWVLLNSVVFSCKHKRERWWSDQSKNKFTEGFNVICNPIPASLLPLKAVVCYRIYPCISRPFMASKEAPKIALDLYMGQRFWAKFQLNNLFKINIITLSNAVDKRLKNECN